MRLSSPSTFSFLSCNSIAVLVCLSIAFGAPAATQAQEFELPPIERRLNNGMMGKDFWFAIPPTIGSFGGSENLYIVVTSFVDTRFELTVGGGSPLAKDVKANELTVLSTDNNQANWAWEVQNSEEVAELGINIRANDPISVSVVTAKSRAADGFAVLPTKLLGTNYISCSYYDTPGFGPNGDIGGGFLIVATKDGTTVNFTLDGVDVGEGETFGGLSVGDSRSINLRAGQAYAVISEGEAEPGQFDLTGSRITSNNPIAVIGFHQRAGLPAAAGFFASTGALSEMLTPVTSWGTTFASFEYSNEGQGTYYRIIASEPDTRYEVFAFTNGELISTKSGLLSEPGDMKEFSESNPNQNAGGFLHDAVLWQADKPVMVMQYSFGESFVSGQPYMALVPPLSQGLKSSFFSVPPDLAGGKLNIFAKGDPSDPESTILRSVRLNGKQLVTSNPSFIVNQLPNTNWYYTEIEVQPGHHFLDGLTDHTAILYGRVSPGGGGFTLGGFSMPVAMAVNHVAVLDTSKPTFSVEIECGVATVLVKDNESISNVEFLEEASDNAKFSRITSDAALFSYGATEFSFSVGPHEGGELAPVKAVFAVLDRAGNFMLDSVEIPASTEFVEATPRRVNFGAVRLGEAAESSTRLENPTTAPVEVLELDLTGGTVFSKVDWPATPLIIPAGGSLELKLMYTPDTEDVDNTSPDRDTVVASTSCFEYRSATVFGRGVTANTAFEGEAIWIAKTTEVGDPDDCYEGQDFGLRNLGSEVVTITDIRLESGQEWMDVPFDLGTLSLPAEGVQLQPDEVFYVSGMCFSPTEAGEFEVRVIFETSADEEILMTWRGVASKSTAVTDLALPGYRLEHARPNPADMETLIAFSLGRTDHVLLSLFDARGNRVAVLIDEVLAAGEHAIPVNVEALAPGQYYYRLNSGEFVAGLPLQLLR